MTRQPLERVAIVNRGEPAMRFIVAAREYRRQHELPLTTIALYTDTDRRSMFVREADEAYSLGTAMFTDPDDGGRKVRYLDYAALENALREHRVDAVWLGWGFVAEHARFADLCRSLRVTFIGPDGEVMRRLGDKITSKQIAEGAGVPVAPWSGGAVASLEDARETAQSLGYPLMIKATAGGGGRGIRKVTGPDELEAAFRGARSEALGAFGDDTVFLERCVTGARHLEVQIIADDFGTVWPLGVRDCSVQRRNQKVLEETPPPGLPQETQDELCAAAVRLALAAGYRNAGTVEFLYEQRQNVASFMEVNARLQVEHPVTEMTYGVDLVKLQLDVARGLRLPETVPTPRGHAIEVRLNAEDAERGFAPSPGTVERFRVPAGPGVRVDTGIEEGDEIPPEFDSMIAKLIAHGSDRREALARLDRALTSSSIVVRGGASNKGFLLDLLGHSAVRSADVDIGWLDSRGADLREAPHPDIALLQAAIHGAELQSRVVRRQFFAAAARGRPETSAEIGRSVELAYRGETYEFGVYRLATDRYRVHHEGADLDVRVLELGRGARRLSVGGRDHRVASFVHGSTLLVEVDGLPYRISRDDGGAVRAPSPGIVVSVSATPGAEVRAGDRLVVLEAMKTEISITAPVSGRVREVAVSANVQVASGATLVVVEPTCLDDDTDHGERVSFATTETVADDGGAQNRCWRNLRELRSLMLGYEVDAGHLDRLVRERGILCAGVPAEEAEMRRLEDQILRIFVDIASLFRRVPDLSAPREAARLSPDQYLFDYLRDIGGRGKTLPPTFITKLERALAHYGVRKSVASLEPDDELREILFRIFVSHTRCSQQLAPLMSILERRLEQKDTLLPLVERGFRDLMGSLVRESQGRFPLVCDLAREVEHEYFDRAVLDEAAQAFYRQASEHVDALASSDAPEERRARIDALVKTPLPLKRFISHRFAGADAPMQELLLEVMLRRYYRVREHGDIRVLACAEHDDIVGATTSFQFWNRDYTVVAACGPYERTPEVLAAIQRAIHETPNHHVVDVELFLCCGKDIGSPDRTVELLEKLLAESALPGRVARVSGIATCDETTRDKVGVHDVTFRRGHDGVFREDRIYRGLHPLMADRHDLWRLREFELERLPSAEDVYLFRASAHANPSDERLVALAEVRDLTPTRDADGNVVKLATLTRVLVDACGAIRRAQATRTERQRLHWNRVFLFLRPPLELTAPEIERLAHDLAPVTRGLGLEKVVLRAHMPAVDASRDTLLELSNPDQSGVTLRMRPLHEVPLQPMTAYQQRVVRLRSRGLVYPYELIKMLAPATDVAGALPPGRFVELDLDPNVGEGGTDRLVAVDREPGNNRANLVVGEITSVTAKYPEGMPRMLLLGDPSRAMGAVAEPECRRINAALARAAEKKIPVEWFAVSAGAKISMESGTENMDWIALVLRRIIEFTQAGGEINIVVTGINVGAQPYWNAEATMLMHTRGILIMTPISAMVLTGKTALDYSGGVSADDNFGIGGYERIMGPNGQAQYFAHDLGEACRILMHHYEHTYVAPGERFPRRAETADAVERDVCASPHGDGFATVGEVFSTEHNPGRKKPFDIRKVMTATIDRDHTPLERWFAQQNAESAVVWDAHIGGYPVCLLGLESQPITRLGFVPTDGPKQWTPGTLFPGASKKVARAINAASGNRPLVVLANLSGFDGSPESMRNLQLEFGAEIGRSVVNFRGPIVFCVISRFHGGAFVVFSNKLNDSMESAALEGTYASVIGGAPAAAVVFAREVKKRTRQDPRILELEERIAAASGAERSQLASRRAQLAADVHSEHLGDVAREFDGVHSVHRAREVGSVHHIIEPEILRPYLISAIERGIAREVP